VVITLIYHQGTKKAGNLISAFLFIANFSSPLFYKFNYFVVSLAHITAMRMTIREFFSFKTNKFFWLNIAAMIVIVAVMVFGVLKLD